MSNEIESGLKNLVENKQKIIDYLNENKPFIHEWVKDDYTGEEMEYRVEFNDITECELVLIIHYPHYDSFWISVPVENINNDLSNLYDLITTIVDEKIDDGILDDREWDY